MYNRIHLHLGRGLDCQYRTQAALALANRHKMELVGIYVNSVPPQHQYGESMLTPNAPNAMKDLQAQDRDALLNSFLESATAMSVHASVCSHETELCAHTTQQWRASDLIVVSQPSRDDAEAAYETEFVTQTVLTAGRPVLVVPSRGSHPMVGDRVLYCWDGSQGAARALADIAFVLRQASELVVLIMDSSRASGDGQSAPLDLTTYCLAHGMPMPEHVHGDLKGEGDTILNAARDCDADLIVMGASGYNKLREWTMRETSASIPTAIATSVIFSC